MQAYHSFDFGGAVRIGHAFRVLCVTGTEAAPLAARLGALGGRIETEAELYAALSVVIDDPGGCDVVVFDCDSLGADNVAQVVTRTLRAVQSRLPVVLISAGFPTHVFPDAREEPILLRAPVSDLSLRIGCEHALRDLTRWAAA
ncbi:hypothetical protein [Gemmobacter sp. 24YEA27]|uniref:hypothetical protein n=1 Tax=Gemmobacter sp. 24YEA27 TaxID=3040672 RepID=UPI0024B34D58|nr:hypothetical protein [Gemmobacter sp. 24YEA27]